MARFALLSLAMFACCHADGAEPRSLSKTNYPLPPRPSWTDPEFDCKARQLLLEYSNKIQGWRGVTAMQEIHDSLQLEALCNVSFKPAVYESNFKPFFKPSTAVVLEVDPVMGDDAIAAQSNGRRAFLTLHAAVDHLRDLRQADVAIPATISLRGGKHRMTQPLHLGQRDSHLNFINHDGEDAIMTGAVALITQWKPYQVCLIMKFRRPLLVR
jgi:hypothetical protein